MTQPDSSLPLYTHIPGVTPHPIGDPRGHSYGAVHPEYPPVAWQGLLDCAPFARGRQLFNAGYYWEAHEAWEAVWISAGRSGPLADFIKGLIKLAAAGVKLREDSSIGARRHLTRAEELLRLTRSRLLASREEPDSAADSGLSTVSTRVISLVEDALRLIAGLGQQLPEGPAPNAGQPVSLLGTL